MKKKKPSVSSRAWRLLRLALLWARKGGAFKRGLMLDLRTVLKSVRARPSSVHYLEREFSFDETPLFSFKRRPRIPCITPSVDLEDDDDWIYYKKRDFFRSKEKEEEEEGEEECCSDDGENDCEICELVEEKKGNIDSDAEEFIEKFYEQMKLQRQLSVLRYNEMLRRGMS